MRLSALLVLAPALAALPAQAAAAPAQLKRGAYLVQLMDCNACHTPMKMGPQGPEPDLSRALSGHPQEFRIDKAPDLGQGPWLWAGAATNTAFAGPWGVSFAANLTADPETGVGRMSEADFIQAIRTGRHLGKGRPILPPMPAPAYGKATDADLQAIYAYLKTTRPIRNEVPDPLPPAARP